jgi:hypothetical protein
MMSAHFNFNGDEPFVEVLRADPIPDRQRCPS